MKHYAAACAIGTNVSAFAAGVGGHIERSVAWMAVCALFTIAYALLRERAA